ncbi:hypothetical protein ARAM_002740 [Aspergillus rambellii]|uniref:Uncharacterized protein n=1 Tax=Aspergillus rambellii TaxID=308745 RepID=A0A0F8X5K7_9EURO|nr:hypothetical protein ARAM_002740 [Aspergillus rambellii]
MALRTSADNAEDVAAGFRRFRDPLPEHATEITGLIADLFTISSSMKSLEDLSKDRHSRTNLLVARPDLELVRASLKYTLEDIVDFFGDLEERTGSSRDAFKRTWMDLCLFFLEESQVSLSTRLSRYKVFLKELEDLVRGQPYDVIHVSGLREAFKALLIQQDSHLAARLSAMSVSSPSSASSNSTAPSSPVSDRRPRNRRSYERARPPHLSPQTPTSPSSGSFFDVPPLTPDAPGSPITSSATSHSLGSNPLSEHWAKQVFLGGRTATRIPNVGESSKCLGDARSGLKPWLRDERFDELLQLDFTGASDFRVYFYLREDDHRVRIVCRSARPSKSSEYFCLPLNLLEWPGTHSVGQPQVSTIEEMVFFFCTFLALRSQDSGRPVGRIRDYELDDEEELFGGPIVDDNYLHALRVYRDNVTGAVRLQASVHKGEMKRAPVWTAFISENVKIRGWYRRVESKVILLSELRQIIFTFSEYTPPRTKKGGYLLKFTSRADADGFIETMAELASLG